MSTSLARQLKGLKSAQKDTLRISSRAKVSFLFDSREAYKIDEEVIYTLCLKGIDELSIEFPKLKNQFEHYKEDVFHESAKDFYRGSQTKDVITTLDTKLNHIITMISPYFMYAASYKILEFLIRVYEVHAYHKTHLFFSFLPFFDTPQYLRLIQCMELKSDSMLSYFEPFASQGIQLRTDILIRFMARENGAYLKSFSDIVFKFLTLKEEQALFLQKKDEHYTGVLASNFAILDLDGVNDESVPHFRFWGTLVFKIISSEKASRSDSFLYVLIPYIAKALTSKVKELQVGALSVILGSLDVSLIAKKLPFSEEYMNAFLTEICKSAANALSDYQTDYFNLCVKTCLRILHAQQMIERLNERLSMFNYASETSKYQIDQVKDSKDEDSSYKWIGDLIKNQEEMLKFIRENKKLDMTPLIYKCLEFSVKNNQDEKESSKIMIKILATLEPSTAVYKLVMSYLFAIVAGHLPECRTDKATKFAVLVLDYLESRDSFIYVQVLDILLQGKNQKHRVLDKIEEIEMEQLGKAKKKVVTIDTGIANQKDTMPVLLALYHKKKTVRKAALLSLYQKWIEEEDINQGQDLRMIASMLIQFIDDQETEDILIVSFTLLEHLVKNQLLSDPLIIQLNSILVNSFIPRHYPPDRQYSIEGFMKGVNLCLSLKNQEFEDTHSIIYILCSLTESCKGLLNKTSFTKSFSQENEIKPEKVSLDKGLNLLTILVKRTDLSTLLDGKIWSVFETYFNNLLKKSQNDPSVCCLVMIDALRQHSHHQDFTSVKNIVSLFIGKLPSFSNTDRTSKERLKVNDILTQALKIHPSLVPAIFETIMIKHLNCDIFMIVDYFTVLYHDSKEDAFIRQNALVLLKKTLDHVSDLNQRTNLLAANFCTFLVALGDTDSQCRNLAMEILKIYEAYENFSKLVKNEKKKVLSIFEFIANKRKIYAIKKGHLLDNLEEFIEDLATTHNAEVISDANFITNLINLSKNNALFEFMMHSISSARTPLELQSYLRFIRKQAFTAEQMEQFCNVLVSIEFKSSILTKELAFQYMPTLIDILGTQDISQEVIADHIHDCLLGVLDQYNNREFELPEQYVLKANRRLVNVTIQLATGQKDLTDGDKFDKIFKQIGLVTDVIQNSMKHPESPGFYLKIQTIELLKAVPEQYISTLFIRMKDMLSVNLCSDIETFKRICFVLECCQSLTLNPENLNHLLTLIHQLGEIISEIGISEEQFTRVDPIEMLIVLINLAQNCIDSAISSVKKLDTASLQELEQYIKNLVSLFQSLLRDLTQIYEKESKLAPPETMLDPVEEFLTKDSLLTSAQKERQDENIEDEEVKIQKDIILYQSLSNLLLLISALHCQTTVKETSHVHGLFTSTSNSLSSLGALEEADHSQQKVYIRQLLNLQHSIFDKIVIRALHSEITLEYNQDLLVYLSDVVTYSESFHVKMNYITKTMEKLSEISQSKFLSLTIILLLKLICENTKVKLNSHDTTATLFTIENEEFKISQKLLSKVMRSEQAVNILTHMIMEINFMSTFDQHKFGDINQKSVQFCEKKAKLLFSHEIIDEVQGDSQWLDNNITSQKTRSKLKYLFMILLDDILPKQSHTDKYGNDRHPLVQYFHKYTMKNLSAESISEITELVLAFDFGTTLIEHELHLIGDTKKTTSGKGVSKAVNNKKDKKEIQRLCKSVERLVDGYRKFNQDFVAMLIPLKVYVPVVTHILTYSDQLILLKTRSLNTLIEVVMKGVQNIASDLTETIEGGFEKAKYIDNHRIDSQLHDLFKKLIAKCGDILSTYATDHKKKEIDTYLQSILILLQKILSYKNQTEMQEIILPRVFEIAKSETSTMLSCSAIMFVTSAFDIYKADLYALKEDLINDIVIKQSLKCIKKVLPGGKEEKDYFSNSVISSILDSFGILMKSIFNQLLTPEQLTEIMSIFFSIPEEKGLGDSPVNHQIDIISSLVAKYVNPQIALHSLFNIFDFIAVSPEEYNSTEEKLKIYCTRYFNSLSKVLRNLKKDFIEEYHGGIAKFFQRAFLIPQTWEKHTGIALSDVHDIHEAILGAFKTFVLKLNEVQLKPIFTKLVKWVSQPVDKNAAKPVKDLDKLYIFFKVANCLLETLMSIFTPYLSYYIQLLTELLSEAFEETHSKSFINFGKDFSDMDNHRLNIVMVVDTLLECIRLNYYFDTESTIPVEYFDNVSDSILHVMDYYIAKGAMTKEQYLSWITNVYQKVIVDVLDSMDNNEVTKSLIDDILKKSKHDLPTVRLASLRITEALVLKLGERFLAFLADVLPYISESIEDANDEVEETARGIVQKIESMTGESIQEYLK